MQEKPTSQTDAQRRSRPHPTPGEHSPSTGWRETAVILDCPGAHDVEPTDADTCGALGCHTDQVLYHVSTDDGRERVLCPTHTRDVLNTEVTV